MEQIIDSNTNRRTYSSIRIIEYGSKGLKRVFTTNERRMINRNTLGKYVYKITIFKFDNADLSNGFINKEFSMK